MDIRPYFFSKIHSKGDNNMKYIMNKENSVTDNAKKLCEDLMKKSGAELQEANIRISGYVGKTDNKDKAAIDISFKGQCMTITTNTDKSNNNALYMSQVGFKAYNQTEKKFVDINASQLNPELAKFYDNIKSEIKVYVPKVVYERYMELKNIIYKSYTDKVKNASGQEVNDIYLKEPVRADYVNKDGIKVECFKIEMRNHSNEVLSLHMNNGGPETLYYTDFNTKDKLQDGTEVTRNVFLQNGGWLKYIRTPKLVDLAKEVDTYLARDDYER